MGTFTLDGNAQAIRSVSTGIKNAFNNYMRADSAKQEAYLDAMGKTKAAEEARSLRMTNDHRESVDRMIADDPDMPQFKKNQLIALKLLGGQHMDNFSRSGEVEQRISHREAVLKDPSLATATAQAHAATSGKAPFDNIGNTGHSMNNVTGEQHMAHPGLAKLFQGNAKSGGNSGKLTLSQQRVNAEIEAARQSAVAIPPEELRRRTAKTTDTGRDNPDYDPTLAKASSLAARRKIGSDSAFDGRLQGKPEQATKQEDPTAAVRFKADPTMSKYSLGNQTQKGFEVKDSTGKLVGYYR